MAPPRPWMGEYVPWMRTPSMHLSTSRVQQIQEPPSVYFIPFSSPRSLLSMLLTHPTRGFFNLFADFPPHLRVPGSTSMCKYPWMGIIQESRATDLGSSEEALGSRKNTVLTSFFGCGRPPKTLPSTINQALRKATEINGH